MRLSSWKKPSAAKTMTYGCATNAIRPLSIRMTRPSQTIRSVRRAKPRPTTKSMRKWSAMQQLFKTD